MIKDFNIWNQVLKFFMRDTNTTSAVLISTAVASSTQYGAGDAETKASSPLYSVEDAFIN